MENNITTAKEWIKKRGLKNPPIDSGISGAVDVERTYVATAMVEYSQSLYGVLKPTEVIKERLDKTQKEYNDLWLRIDANDDAEDRGYFVKPEIKRELDTELNKLELRMKELEWVLGITKKK